VLVSQGFKNLEQKIQKVLNPPIKIQLSHFLKKVRILRGIMMKFIN